MKGATVTLSLNDVNFSLSALDDGGGVDFVKDKGDFVVSLTRFSGTLRVSAKSVTPVMTQSTMTTAATLPSPRGRDFTKRRLETDDPHSEPSKRIRDELAKLSDDVSVGSEPNLAQLEDHLHDVLFGDSNAPTSAFKRADAISRGTALDSPSEKESVSMFQLTTTLGQPDFSQYSDTDIALHQNSHSTAGTADDGSRERFQFQDGPSSRTGPARVSVGPTPRISSHSHLGHGVHQSPSSHCLDTELQSPKPTSTERTSVSVPPCPRWGHTLTVLDDNRLLVYGGQAFDATTQLPVTLSDVHVCSLDETDSDSSMWVQPFHCHGLPRQWHTSTYLPGRRLLISLGGESVGAGTSTDNSARHQEASVMVLDTEIMLWYPPTISGDASPMKNRSGHSATRLGASEIVVFGGVRNKRTWLNTISVLDCAVWKWYNIPKQSLHGSAPPPRSYHSAVAVGNDRIVIFGGNDKTKCFDSVHVLQRTLEHESQHSHGSPASSAYQWKWSHPVTSGTKPQARTGHAAVLLDNGTTLWVHGGWDPNEDDVTDEHDEAVQNDNNSDDMIFGDSFYLDTLTWTWTNGPSVPVSPKRVGHAAVRVPNGGGGGSGDQSDTSIIRLFGGRVPDNAFTGDCRILSV